MSAPERRASTSAERESVVRDTGPLVVFGVAMVVAAFLLGEMVVRGDWRSFGVSLPFGLLIAWVLWLVLVNPHVSYNTERVRVVNIGRIHDLPWARLTAVRQRLGIAFETDSGPTIVAVGATAPRGRGVVVGGITGQLPNAADFSKNANPLEAMRVAAAPSDAQVTSRWDTRALAIGAVLAGIVLVDLVILAVGPAA